MQDVVQMLEGEKNNVTIPPNPFAFTNPTGANIESLERPLQKLAVISELRVKKMSTFIIIKCNSNTKSHVLIAHNVMFSFMISI